MYVITITKWKLKLAWLVGFICLSIILASSVVYWKSSHTPVSDKLEDEVLSEPIKVQGTTIKK